MRTKTEDETLNPRHTAIVEALPRHKWCISRAALAVGYKKSYVDSNLVRRLKQDVGFCRAVRDKQAQIAAGSWSIEQWRAKVTDLLGRCRETGDRTNEQQLLKMIGQYIGAFEKDNQQRQPRIGMVII